MNILDEKPKALLENFLQEYGKLFHIDIDKSRKILKDKSLFESLTEKWYANPKISIYDDDYYFVDVFDCYITYSRKYLKSLFKPTLEDGSSIYDLLKNIDSFVDIGCGLGYSTYALKEIFPKAKGYGTNLKNTKQWNFCLVIADRAKFRLVESVDEIGHKVDLVFASEYFEHILNPIEHLKNIIEKVCPKHFIIANSFNTRSIGHFENYKDNSSMIHKSKISRIFNNFLVKNGYSRVKAKMWNNRPQIWQKNES